MKTESLVAVKATQGTMVDWPSNSSKSGSPSHLDSVTLFPSPLPAPVAFIKTLVPLLLCQLPLKKYPITSFSKYRVTI